MKKNKFIILLILALILLACNMPVLTGTGETTEPAVVVDPQAEQTRVAQGVALTLAALASDTPQYTATPSPTVTPSAPMVHVTTDTNCRQGPGMVYDIVGGLYVGTEAEVYGVDPAQLSWYIRNDDAPNGYCWIGGLYATVVGDTSTLPVLTPQPTPTPAAGFSATYLSTATCAGLYGFRIQLVNTGSVLWSSYKVDTYDATTGTTTSYTDDYFKDYTGCGPFSNELHDLEPGENGVGGDWGTGVLHYDPAGHNITMTFTLCANDGLTGTCSTKAISFVP